jgi:Leucine-rich repeat (LRR) protein
MLFLGVKPQKIEETGAKLAIVYNSLDGYLIPTSSYQVNIPTYTILKQDGEQIKQLLNDGINVYITVKGTGPCIKEQATAIKNVIAAANFKYRDINFGVTGTLRRPTDLLTDATLDPCNGVAGIFCEQGHIVALWWYQFTIDVLHADIGKFTHLRYLDISGNNIPSIPATICSCTQLQMFSATTNQISSLPACMSTMVSINYFDVSHNQLTSIPNLSALISLHVFDISVNQITSLSHGLIDHMNELQIFSCSSNQLSGSPPMFTDKATVEHIDLSMNKFNGSFPADAFNGLPALTYINVQQNMISGGIPEFIDTVNIVFMSIAHNLFSGVFPNSFENLVAMQTLLADYNLIESPYVILGACLGLLELSLSHNLLTTNTGDPADDGDAAAAIMYGAGGQDLVTLDVSHNFFTGTWVPGWLSYNYKLIKMNLGYNEIESFPQEIFDMSMTSVDMSHNNLKDSLPDQGTQPSRSFTLLDVRGNSNFHGINNQLPAWATISEQYSKTLNEPFLCPNLASSKAPAMTFLLDPSYYGHSTCKCDRGTFGSAPDCYSIPETQTLSALEYEVVPAYNISFTDIWYGEQRMTEGLSTSWVIDKSMPASSNSVTAPVLMINITFYINLDTFKFFTDIIDIYEGN